MENQKVFNQSSIVSELLNERIKTPIVLSEEDRNSQFPCNQNLLNKALLRICTMWNKDERSRNFIKHLIGNFLPVNPMQKVLNFGTTEIAEEKNRDCLLGIKLVGLNQLSQEFGKFSTEKLFIDSKAIVEKREYTPEEKKKLEAIRDSFPVEIRKASYAYCGNKSDKYMCRESINALLMFTEHCLLFQEKEISFLLTKKRMKESNQNFSKEKQLDNKQLNRVVKASAFGMSSLLDDATIEKLKNLK